MRHGPRRRPAILRLLTAAIVLAVAGAGQSTARAATPEAPVIGEATLVVNQVQGSIGPITQELAIRDNVFSEEELLTAADAATRLTFADSTLLSIGPRSRVTLDRFVYDPKQSTGELLLSMVTGVFEFATGSMPHKSYSIHTPFATLAVRGTRLLVAPDIREVICEEGVCVVTFPDGGEYVLTRNQCLRPRTPGAVLSSAFEVVQAEACSELVRLAGVMHVVLASIGGGGVGIQTYQQLQHLLFNNSPSGFVLVPNEPIRPSRS